MNGNRGTEGLRQPEGFGVIQVGANLRQIGAVIGACVQIDADAAAALGELVRERWRIATGDEAVDPNTVTEGDPWPASCDAAQEDVDIGIARTLPAYEDRAEVREVERLYLDSIEAAQRFIYMENQYLSSQCIVSALANRLQESGGPQVVIVNPEKPGAGLSSTPWMCCGRAF